MKKSPKLVYNLLNSQLFLIIKESILALMFLYPDM